MTTTELISHLNQTYGIEKQWPKKLEVDIDTYANCAELIFNKIKEDPTTLFYKGFGFGRGYLYVGENGGPMFKNVEILLKRD